MQTYRTADMNGLHDEICLDLAYAPASQLDTISSIDVSRHDVLAVADSMAWNFNLKNLWLTPSRWTMMVNQYLDQDDVTLWLEKCMKYIGFKGRGTAVLRTKTVKARGGEATGHTNKETRRWGSCMLSVSYKAIPTPTITLHSRTSYMGYLGVLDMTVAWALGRELANRLGVPIESFKFVWMIESVQWHSFKSLAFLLSNADEETRKQGRRVLTKKLIDLSDYERSLAESPAMKISRAWLMKVRVEDRDKTTYGDMTYNTYRRIRRRWHTEVFGLEHAQTFEGWSYRNGAKKEFFKAYQPLPDCWTKNLSLNTKKMNISKVEAVAFTGDPDEGDDE